MLRKIDRDVKRFRQIVHGVIKKEFRKYLTQGELIGRQGKHIVSIPLPQIEIPRFQAVDPTPYLPAAYRGTAAPYIPHCGGGL